MTVYAPLFATKPASATLVDGIWLGRNWHLTSKLIWSRAQAATLDVAAAVFPDPVPLVIELCVFDAHAAQPRTVTLSSPGHPEVQVTVHSSDAVSIRSVTPVQTDGADHATVTLTLDAITSPLRAGLSADDRLLGLHIRTVKTGQNVLSLPLDLGNPDVARAVLRAGWSAVEPGNGAWSLAQTASLVLPGYLRRQAGDILCLTADVLPRDAATAPLHVDVFCDGLPAATWRFPPSTSGLLRCPTPGWRDNTDITITLRLQNPLSPKALGINADTRPLGLMLRAITLEDGAEPEDAPKAQI